MESHYLANLNTKETFVYISHRFYNRLVNTSVNEPIRDILYIDFGLIWDHYIYQIKQLIGSVSLIFTDPLHTPKYFVSILYCFTFFFSLLILMNPDLFYWDLVFLFMTKIKSNTQQTVVFRHHHDMHSVATLLSTILGWTKFCPRFFRGIDWTCVGNIFFALCHDGVRSHNPCGLVSGPLFRLVPQLLLSIEIQWRLLRTTSNFCCSISHPDTIHVFLKAVQFSLYCTKTQHTSPEGTLQRKFGLVKLFYLRKPS